LNVFFDFGSYFRIYSFMFTHLLAGAIAEGPDENVLCPIAKQAIPSFLLMLRDQEVVVRDSAAWVVGHVCELVPNVLDMGLLGSILEAFFSSLDDQPRVAKNICWVCLDSL
jgi:importin subunit beta-1